jgi:hypothetical protein
MTNKSKPLGAIVFMAAISLAFPAVAQYGSEYSPSVTGGGSPGYNHGLKYYRLKRHHPHASVKPKKRMYQPAATGKGKG